MAFRPVSFGHERGLSNRITHVMQYANPGTKSARLRNGHSTDARNDLFSFHWIIQSCRNPNPESRVRRTPIYETGVFNTRAFYGREKRPL